MAERRAVRRRRVPDRRLNPWYTYRPTRLQTTAIISALLLVIDGPHIARVWITAIGMIAAAFSTAKGEVDQ